MACRKEYFRKKETSGSLPPKRHREGALSFSLTSLYSLVFLLFRGQYYLVPWILFQQSCWWYILLRIFLLPTRHCSIVGQYHQNGILWQVLKSFGFSWWWKWGSDKIQFVRRCRRATGSRAPIASRVYINEANSNSESSSTLLTTTTILPLYT